jgi:hypothetical protein
MSLAATTFSIDRPQLPLAAYLEVAAHLRQVASIQVERRYGAWTTLTP